MSFDRSRRREENGLENRGARRTRTAESMNAAPGTGRRVTVAAWNTHALALRLIRIVVRLRLPVLLLIRIVLLSRWILLLIRIVLLGRILLLVGVVLLGRRILLLVGV